MEDVTTVAATGAETDVPDATGQTATETATTGAPTAPAPAGTPTAVPAVASPKSSSKKKNSQAATGAGDAISPTDGTEGTPAGPVNNPLALRHERLQGTVSKFVPSSGWGFVKSHLFDGELGFKTESIMPECQSYEFQEGEAVEFDVQSDDRGRPHAVALKPLVGRKPTECLGQRHRGYVRRFADRWGFLNAAAFDGDLFVHRDNLLLVPEQLNDGQPPLRAGQAVEFDVALDDRGRTVAKQITTSALLRPCDWIGRRLQGYVRSFQGAWGFLNSDKFAGDLFVHRDSLLGQSQGVELAVGAMVEFDVERDHHKKGGKNRLVARQVVMLHQPNTVPQPPPAVYTTMQPQQFLPQAMPPAPQPSMGLDPLVYSTMPPALHAASYGSTLNPQAASFAPLQTAPMYYSGAQAGGILPDQQQQQAQQHLGAPHMPGVPYAQPQYQYPDPVYPQQPVVSQQPLLPGALGQQVVAPLQYGQQMMAPGAQPQYGQPMPPQLQQQLTQPQLQPQIGQPQYQSQLAAPPPYGQQPPPCGQMPYGQPVAGAVPPQNPVQPQPVLQGASDGAVPSQLTAMQQVPGAGSEPPPATAAAADGAQAQAAVEGQQQVLLHITTHDWEPDQAGQLRVRKGTLVKVSHRAAHGWVYASTVQQGDSSEPPSEGWVPQAVAKHVSLGRAITDWPAEGSGTLGLQNGDLIAVSKEAERGWVYGERINPKRPDWPADGWLPKKVLEYIM